MKNDIMAEIALKRAGDIKARGVSQGLSLPEKRIHPLVPFLEEPGVICEIKRRSPSVKDINMSLDPVALAKSYTNGGIRSISVLTEENYFGGTLEDLIKIKISLPQTAVLRKDFLLTEEDVLVSFRAGADAFLLIASLLDAERLGAMYRLGRKLGMTPVVELHSFKDVEKAGSFKPELIGINSRDLHTFRINPLQPLKIRSMIKWNCRVIYESGVKTQYDMDFVRGTGFDAVLVGEAAVRDGGFAKKLAEAFGNTKGKADFSRSNSSAGIDLFKFWQRLYRRYKTLRPLVKICGITNHVDLEKVISLGADAAGFILAESPRRVEPQFIESCRKYDILKIGVVVLAPGQQLPGEIADLLDSGALDAIQFHGDEMPAEYLKWPGYKAVRLKNVEDVEGVVNLPGPAVLIDAFSPSARGGTGKRISPDLVRGVSSARTLWLAGGINPGNVYNVIRDFKPDLVDVSSGVEETPGKKDHAKLAELFSEIERWEQAAALGDKNEEVQ